MWKRKQAKAGASSVQVVHRLSVEAYRELEKELNPIVAPTSAELAAYQLGMQKVLQVVRTGFTVGLPD